jgi:hypothetical protein
MAASRFFLYLDCVRCRLMLMKSHGMKPVLKLIVQGSFIEQRHRT